MSNRLGGKQGTAYMGTNANQPPNWTFTQRDPTQYDVKNVTTGDLWLNTLLGKVFVLVSMAQAQATWVQIAPSGAGNDVIAWTPILTFGGGSTGLTYATQAGHYVTIGNIVYFDMQIELTSKGSSTGTASIAGLPSNAARDSIYVTSESFMATAGSLINGRTAPGTSTIVVDYCQDFGARLPADDTVFADNSLLEMNGFYLTS